MYTLYSLAGSCSTGITVLMEKLELDFTVVSREDVPNYQEIVPTNQVPAIKVGDKIITEGAAIVLYLLEKHGSDMLPTDIEQKAEFLQWLMFDYATLHPAYSKVLALRSTMEEGEIKQQTMQAMADKVSKTWEILDNRLANQQYIVGDKPTIIDYLATIYSSWGKYFPTVNVKIGDNIRRHAKEISALPEFQAAYKTEAVEFQMAA